MTDVADLELSDLIRKKLENRDLSWKDSFRSVEKGLNGELVDVFPVKTTEVESNWYVNLEKDNVREKSDCRIVLQEGQLLQCQP